MLVEHVASPQVFVLINGRPAASFNKQRALIGVQEGDEILIDASRHKGPLTFRVKELSSEVLWPPSDYLVTTCSSRVSLGRVKMKKIAAAGGIELDNLGSRQVAAIAIAMALTGNREEEIKKKAEFAKMGIRTAAVDCGGEFISSVKKFVEHAVVAAKREGVIKETHSEEGAVAGATREALNQISMKAVGFNVGGKIGIARYKDHISVAIFLGVGLLHLDEVAIGLGHRAVP